MDLVISAGPGCGKSHTIKTAYLSLYLPNEKLGPVSEEQAVIYDWCRENLPRPKRKRAIFLAFQRTVADDLRKKIPDTADVYSLNGFGQTRVQKVNGYQKLNQNRGLLLLEKHLGKSLSAYNFQDQKAFKQLLQFIRKLKQEDLKPGEEAFEFVQGKYTELCDLPLPRGNMVELAKDLFKRMAIPNNNLEYIDQLWLGEKCISNPPYDVAFVDEFQDLSQIMLKLARKTAPNIIYCGDPNQSITRFAGAGDSIYEELQCTSDKELPLKTSFRLPPNIAREANKIHPTAKLRSAKDKEGINKWITFEQIPDVCVPAKGSAILCRTNAPLVAAAMKLMAMNVPCYILKTDLIKQLQELLSYKKSDIIQTLTKRAQSSKPLQAMILLDQIEILNLLHEEDNPREKLESLCKPGPNIVLSTVHKAKGLEWQNVVILNPPIKHPLATRPEELKQETNVEFVAITRTKENLFWTTLP